MSIYYVLEVSKTKPTVFRISVSRSMDDFDTVMKAAVENNYARVTVCSTPEALTEALEPYLRMEENT